MSTPTVKKSVPSNDLKIVPPKNCHVMVSFNDGASGQDAEDLANFLTANGRPTFCTRIYCPDNAGDWRISTMTGVRYCTYYIPLMTNGWQKSKNCQSETKMVLNRYDDGTVA